MENQIAKYQYVIIKDNHKDWGKESAILDNVFESDKKYALIVKNVYADGTEKILTIWYSDNIKLLQEHAESYPSWYNYVYKKSKNLQGYVTMLYC